VHTITFGEGPPGPPPNWPVSGWSAPAGPPPWDLGSADYDGTGFLNTGIILKDSSATVHFTAAGTFPFLCVIHPGMAGTVEVLEDGAATTQEEADEASDATSAELLEQVDAARQARADGATSEEGSHGSKTWTAFADATTQVEPMPGGDTGYLELLEFIPAELSVAPGDANLGQLGELKVSELPPTDVRSAPAGSGAQLGILLAAAALGGATWLWHRRRAMLDA